MNINRSDDFGPITPQVFNILLALAEKPMYGYGIIHQCQADAARTLTIDKGSIYRTIHRLTQLGYVEATVELPGRGSTHPRKYYALTSRGRFVLEAECDRYRQASILGQHRLRRLEQPAGEPVR